MVATDSHTSSRSVLWLRKFSWWWDEGNKLLSTLEQYLYWTGPWHATKWSVIKFSDESDFSRDRWMFLDELAGANRWFSSLRFLIRRFKSRVAVSLFKNRWMNLISPGSTKDQDVYHSSLTEKPLRYSWKHFQDSLISTPCYCSLFDEESSFNRPLRTFSFNDPKFHQHENFLDTFLLEMNWN